MRIAKNKALGVDGLPENTLHAITMLTQKQNSHWNRVPDADGEFHLHKDSMALIEYKLHPQCNDYKNVINAQKKISQHIKRFKLPY